MLSFVAGIIAAVVGAAFPAIGAVTFHQAPKALMSVFPDGTGAQWIDRLTALRSGEPMNLDGMIGLVSMPSYHVALSVIVAWSLRGFRFLFPIGVVYALGTTASAPIIGGHYFVDLVVGAALVGIMILAGKIWRIFANASMTALGAVEAPQSVLAKTPPE